ncbi:Protein phosphatase 1L [Hondaea fermentalgiana]|uniref:Protein phosphatase 1L n=1 Tax=Hondaea fermentalgiana TaxID=2315210 RepID=A0A2R5GT98_9STRA|nr:Protein phosphatase 1L [Hondaea fermentalgiana]|eukprot:GBG34060.1 Protein phosphatase 1L [Hondaea fermentalgiana]
MEVQDDSVHSTVAGLRKAENLGGKLKGSLGSLRRSLPRGLGGMSAQSMRSMSKSSGASLVSEELMPEQATGFGPHRSFSRPEGRGELGKMVSHQYDASSLQYGVAQAMGKKDQDRYDVRLGNEDGEDVHYFGVFDGHGTSALAADICVGKLYDAVASYDKRARGSSAGLDSSLDGDEEDSVGPLEEQDLASLASSMTRQHAPMTMPSDEAIAYAYNRMDEYVRASRHAEPRSGTCAVTVFVESEPAANLLDDDAASDETQCKAAWCGDCRAIMITQDGSVDQLTLDHRIEVNDPERVRIEEADHAPRSGLLESELWRRETERASRSGEVLRPHSFIGRRHLNGVPVGPAVVFSHSGGVSLQVTRSIGDTYAARSVIAEPDIVSFSIPRGEYARFVLASDGIFEVLDTQDVARFVAKIGSPAKAAAKLAAHAKQKRLYGGMAPDDITAVVVDINPMMRRNFKPGNLSKASRLLSAFK